jgi:hypothetical protein
VNRLVPTDLPPLVQRAVQRLIRTFTPERIVLFGTEVADATQGPGVVHLLVVAHVDGNPQFHQRRARQLASDSFPPIDIVLATPAEVAGPPAARSLFLGSILSSGVSLYIRP